jgi:hypothetical protein
MTESTAAAAQTVEPKRGPKQILLSYFYWTYSRGTLHYDVMVTLILVFIFITPHVWDYGDKPQTTAHVQHPMQVISNGERGMIITVYDADAQVPAGASFSEVKKILRKAVEPITGDAVFVDSWETTTDSQGNLLWKVAAHR